MGENPSNEGINEIGNGAVKGIANVLKNVAGNSSEDILEEYISTNNIEGKIGCNNDSTCVTSENVGNANSGTGYNIKSSGTAKYSNNGENIGKNVTGTTTGANTFKVAKTNLPEKTGFWTKVKNALLYDVTIELTPYQQKVEDEINDFLHQEVTWQSFKNFLFQEVPITYKGKRIF